MIKNFGHRGFSGKYPENTMLAFTKAIEAGCEGIEFDVHFTKDKELVIIHDELLNRTTNGSGLVCSYTLAELKGLDASAGFGGMYGKNEIPTLTEYFELVKNKNIITNIELKTGIIPYEGIEAAVIEKIQEYNLVDRIIISSFNHYSVMRAKEICPRIKCGFLEGSWIVDAAAYTKAHGIECYHPLLYILNKEIMEEMRLAGLEVNTWTVNSDEEMMRMIDFGVDAVMTNYPDKFASIRENLNVAVMANA
ncbi:glycerophosphodiester phosphodiesterase [Oscillospiraceae bacterium PP1C4]